MRLRTLFPQAICLIAHGLFKYQRWCPSAGYVRYGNAKSWNVYKNGAQDKQNRWVCQPPSPKHVASPWKDEEWSSGSGKECGCTRKVQQRRPTKLVAASGGTEVDRLRKLAAMCHQCQDTKTESGGHGTDGGLQDGWRRQRGKKCGRKRRLRDVHQGRKKGQRVRLQVEECIENTLTQQPNLSTSRQTSFR